MRSYIYIICVFVCVCINIYILLHRPPPSLCEKWHSIGPAKRVRRLRRISRTWEAIVLDQTNFFPSFRIIRGKPNPRGHSGNLVVELSQDHFFTPVLRIIYSTHSSTPHLYLRTNSVAHTLSPFNHNDLRTNHL